MIKVPVTSDPRIVWLAQRGLLPSPETFALARLLHSLQVEVSEAKRGENAESS